MTQSHLASDKETSFALHRLLSEPKKGRQKSTKREGFSLDFRDLNGLKAYFDPLILPII